MNATATNPSSPPPQALPVRRHPEPTPPPLRTTRVLLVDDDRAASYSLWALLHWQPGIRICDTAETAGDAIALAARLRPEVCLVSADFGDGDGPRLTHRLTQLSPPPQVLLYAKQAVPALEAIAAMAGASGALWRYGEADDLACTIRRTAAGDYQRPHLTGPAIRAVLDNLQDRDRSMAAMLLIGISPDAIARTLGISASSVRARRREILYRLGRTLSTAEV